MSVADEMELIERYVPDAREQLAKMGTSFERVRAVFERRRARKMREALRRQRLAAKINGERRTLHTRDGGGQVLMQIDPFFYHYWGQRKGYDCWDSIRNPDFTREILRDNPECRIKNHVRPGMETLAMANNKAPVRGKRGRWAL